MKSSILLCIRRYAQVVAIREAQTSNLQARSVRWLTILGTFFVPLSVVAGVMSMGGSFLPGEDRFWVYFAVTSPMLLVIGVILLGITNGRQLILSIYKFLDKGSILDS